MTLRTILASGAIAAVLVGAAGCGGGGSSDPGLTRVAKAMDARPVVGHGAPKALHRAVAGGPSVCALVSDARISRKKTTAKFICILRTSTGSKGILGDTVRGLKDALRAAS